MDDELQKREFHSHKSGKADEETFLQAMPLRNQGLYAAEAENFELYDIKPDLDSLANGFNRDADSEDDMAQDIEQYIVSSSMHDSAMGGEMGLSLTEELRNWAIQHGIDGEALDELLVILREHVDEDLPASAMELLHPSSAEASTSNVHGPTKNRCDADGEFQQKVLMTLDQIMSMLNEQTSLLKRVKGAASLEAEDMLPRPADTREELAQLCGRLTEDKILQQRSDMLPQLTEWQRY